jgi:hypothetical protein
MLRARLARADRLAGEFLPRNTIQGPGFVALPSGTQATASSMACAAFTQSNTKRHMEAVPKRAGRIESGLGGAALDKVPVVYSPLRF